MKKRLVFGARRILEATIGDRPWLGVSAIFHHRPGNSRASAPVHPTAGAVQMGASHTPALKLARPDPGDTARRSMGPAAKPSKTHTETDSNACECTHTGPEHRGRQRRRPSSGEGAQPRAAPGARDTCSGGLPPSCPPRLHLDEDGTGVRGGAGLGSQWLPTFWTLEGPGERQADRDSGWRCPQELGPRSGHAQLRPFPSKSEQRQ